MLTVDLFEKWTEKYKKSIDCSHPRGFSQKAHCAGRKKHNESVEHTEPVFIQALRDFLPIAAKVLELDHIPKIILKKELHDTNVPTFGRFTNEEKVVYCVINNRQPNDILRTLAHELVHYKQGEEHELSAGSWHTGSPVENDASARAGVIMRHFNTKYPKYLKAAPIILPNDKIEEDQDRCPPATQDISLNLKNRQKAIDEYGYGPLNPLESNVKFWKNKADMWQLDSIDDAKKSLCGNCAAFDQTKHALDCIEKGIGDDQGSEDPHDVVEAGDLGYCRFLKFKCASLRTCDAWVVGGPITEQTEQVEENLRKWFKEKWVRFGPDGKIRGACARGSDKEGKPKCLPQSKAHALGKKGRASAAAKKRREDPNPERRGAAKNVATKVREEQFDENCWKGYHKEGNKKMFGKTVPNCVKNESQESCPECGGAMYPDTMINEKKDACYYKVKSRYKVWPSAYASGALVQCRKKGAANWGSKSESVEEDKHCNVKNAVPELKAALEKRKTELNKSSDKQVYDKIDKIMTRIANTYDITGQELHDMWTKRYGEIPDTWIIENFADGRGPGRPGDSQRHGIPKHATIAQLEKAAKAPGRKGQLARWQINMRRGRKK